MNLQSCYYLKENDEKYLSNKKKNSFGYFIYYLFLFCQDFSLLCKVVVLC